MITYQDYEKIRDKGGNLPEFIDNAISEHKATAMYAIALDAQQYVRQKNTTITLYRKLLYTITGKAVPDNYSANHKCASNFFNRFVTQENQYLLGNGVILEKEEYKDALGEGFDEKLQKAGKNALVEGISFIFWNFDHIETFKYTEFVPLWDEYTGKLRAGIRFWQIDQDKPLVAVLYDELGHTQYVKEKGTAFVEKVKKTDYKLITTKSVVDGEVVKPAGNYAVFPIFELWGNPEHQSTLVGMKENIDCYDLIKSGFANDLDDASMIYWTISNAGGMTDTDLVKFVERMKTIKAVAVEDDGAKAESHTIEVPYQSRETYLTRIETDLYNDARALNVEKLSAGNVTATAIRAAYQSLDDKCDDYEYCILECLVQLFKLVGVPTDSISFKRNRIANQTEETVMVLSAQTVLDDETILRHLPFLSPDEIEGILKRKDKEEMDRIELGGDDKEEEPEEDDTNDDENGDDNKAGTNDKKAKK